MIRNLFVLVALGSTLSLLACSDGDTNLAEPSSQSSISTVDTSNPSDMPTEANVDATVSSYDNPDVSGVSTRTYTVKSGDTLWEIAKDNNTSAGIIKALNGLTTNTIRVGQTLKLPAQ
ncbi:MAG: LysM peptidoglycan-binding domain-containing protein [Verrucomicrobiota bacterium]